MLRVLTLSTLFPNDAQPTLGLFVERQTSGLAARSDVALEVVAPVGLPPWPLWHHPHYAARAVLPRRQSWKGLSVHRPVHPVLPGPGRRWTARRMARALLPLLREIRARFPFDVIDAEFFWPDGPAAMHLAAALGVPFSVKARGSDISHWGRQPAIRKQLLDAAAAAGGLLAVSQALKRSMVALGMREDRIRVHYTGVDLDRFRPRDRREAKAAMGIAGALIATVGALIPRKGQALALDALARLPDATLALAGEGPDRKALEAQARALGLGARVRFLGAQTPEQVADLLAAADLMLLPSRSEGLANVWIEAMASGTPVVAPTIDGAEEAITPEAGILVPREAAALAEAARVLIEHPPDRATVRKAAERFRWETNSAQLFEHLSKVAAG
ncbi:MAG TPA: glycosyltransferase [Allosphingosinicella sp.]|nr:glycosyltransferase [Allosphingosinicella sp.]